MALGRWMLDAFGRIQIEKHWVQVDGHRMHYLKAGAGPELILLHGLLGHGFHLGANHSRSGRRIDRLRRGCSGDR